MKNFSLFFGALLTLGTLVSAPAAKADGGGGGGGGHDPKHHAHRAAPGAAQSANTAGQQLGFQQNAQGNYDSVNRIIINNTTETVLDKSAAIDTMLATDAIAPEGWMMLKSVMADTMESAAAQQETGPELPTEANGGAANGSGETGYVDSTPAPSLPNVAPAALAETDPELSTYSGSTATSTPTTVGSGSRGSNSDSVASSSGTPAVFSGFALPGISTSTGSSAANAGAADREIASMSPQKISAPAAASSGFSALQSGSAGEQRTLALAQALAGKRNGESGTDTTVQKAAPKKKSSFPDPIRAIFGKSKAKYAGVKATKSPLTKFTTEKSGVTVALPPQETTQILAEEDEDESNWTLLFLMAMGLFGTAAALYVAWKRPRKSTIQLMVPGNGEHFTIRASNNVGEYILDIKDARGNLVRSAGMLRPQSVARAAVLPPSLAAQLGAEGSFDRFEFTAEGEFRPTDKEEGYQIFPFVLN